MDFANWHIAMAAGVAGLVIGCVSIPLSTKIKSPAETLSFPALLPMVPGKFAYGSIQSLVELLSHKHDDPLFDKYFALFNYNWITCTLTIMAMVIGVTIPLFAFRNHGKVLLRQMRNQLLLHRSENQ